MGDLEDRLFSTIFLGSGIILVVMMYVWAAIVATVFGVYSLAAGAPIDKDAVYGVVSNNFMRSGGDGYSVFSDKGMNAYDFGPDLADVTAEFLAANAPYTPYLDGRINIVE